MLGPLTMPWPLFVRRPARGPYHVHRKSSYSVAFFCSSRWSKLVSSVFKQMKTQATGSSRCIPSPTIQVRHIHICLMTTVVSFLAAVQMLESGNYQTTACPQWPQRDISQMSTRIWPLSEAGKGRQKQPSKKWILTRRPLNVEGRRQP